MSLLKGVIITVSFFWSTSCWVQDDIVFYVTVVGFIVLILLANLSVFIVVLIQIKHMRTNKLSANSKSSVNDLRAVASLTVLLGLTWSMGFFSFGPGRVAMMYLFSILNSLQGRQEWKLNFLTTANFEDHIAMKVCLIPRLLCCRILCVLFPLLDERQCEEAVENVFVLWPF